MRNNTNSAKKSNYDPKTRTYTGKINKIRDRKNYTAKIKTNFHKELNKKADPSMDNLPDFYKEIFEEVDKEKEQEGKAESKPRSIQNNFNSSKPNPFKRTMQKRDQIQAEIRAKREEKEREFKERADLKEKNEKLRKKQKSKLNQRGKKGQLILSNHIDHLLTKIQK